MVATFGDVVYESSRAFADDEEEELLGQTGLSFQIETTSAGKTFIESRKDGGEGLVFCAFSGKVAVGFGDILLTNSCARFDLLADVFMVGQGENVVDMYLNRPKKKPVARLFHGGKENPFPVVFALFYNYAVPRYSTNEIMEKITEYMDVCHHVVVFHSDTAAYFQSDENCDGKVFSVANSNFPKSGSPKSAVALPSPNVVGGISAAILMRAEMTDKPGLLLASYGENEIVDSISLRPFSSLIGIRKKVVGISENFNLSNVLGWLDVNSLKSNNPVEISNLYI